jgi:lipopolysaccharide/colanic/teichoic acid biosynthesis glycosyltransferase
MTGLWQVSGRSLCSDQERIRLDLEYVERWSLWLDLWILLLTPATVLLARGAY